MSRSRQRLEAMLGVAALRAIGTELARARAAEARRDLERARSHVEIEVQQLDAAVGGWNVAVAGGTFDPLAAAFWGHAVNLGEVGVAEARHAQSEREGADTAARDQFGQATAQERCAADLLRRARFERAVELLQREEDERADQTTRRFAR